MAWLNMEINKAVLCAHMKRNSSLPLEIQEPPPPRTTKLLKHLTIMQMNSYICCIRTLPPKKCKRGDVHRQGLLWFLYTYTHVHISLFSHDCPGVCFILLQNIILHPRTFSLFGTLSCTQSISLNLRQCFKARWNT